MFFKKLIYGTKFYSVEHTRKNDDEYYNVLELRNKNNSLEKTASNSYNSHEDVLVCIPENQHLFVIVNNNKVLSKRIEGIHELNKSVSLAFPNIKTSDFAIEVLPQETHTFVSICRNSDIENILDIYKKRNLEVIGYSLGNNAIANIASYVTENKLQTSNAIISIDINGSISDITKTDKSTNEFININGIEIASSEVLNLSGILSYYTNTCKTENNFTEKSNQLKDDFKQKKIFSNALKLGLGFILLGLFINFLFFSNYRDKISSLSNEQQVNERSKESLLLLTNEVNRKKSLVSDITSSTNSKVSFYLDEIGGSIPTTISLTSILFQPIQKSIKSGKEIEINSNVITVAGISSNSDEYSDWISALEKIKWIERISVLEYGVGSKSKTTFEIQIKLQE